MNSGGKKLNLAQAKANVYVKKHKLVEVVSEMINNLIHVKDEKPIAYMVKYLSNYLTEKERKESGIYIKGPLPQKIPLMSYPKFGDECTHLLSKYLSRDMWSGMTKRMTKLGGKIQMCVQSGVYDEKEEIGIYATDEEAYKVFDDIFTPIIQDLHPKYDLKVNYRNEFDLNSVQDITLSPKIKNKLSFIKVSARRNFKDYPFTPMMSTQIKVQVEKKIVETLGEVYDHYHQLAKIDEKTSNWLNSVGIDISKQTSHSNAGINEDWPNGRGVFIDDNKAFVILVNFEDHVQVFAIGEDGNFSKSLTTLIKILSKFEKMGYAKHSTLGFLTASPKNLGTTLDLGVRIKLKTAQSEDHIEFYKKENWCSIKQSPDSDTEYDISFCETLAKNLTENYAIDKFGDCLSMLAQGENCEEKVEQEKAQTESFADSEAVQNPQGINSSNDDKISDNKDQNNPSIKEENILGKNSNDDKSKSKDKNSIHDTSTKGKVKDSTKSSTKRPRVLPKEETKYDDSEDSSEDDSGNDSKAGHQYNKEEAATGDEDGDQNQNDNAQKKYND
ncbi:unnamed protein product [Moneuplotes crassus]|uniref:Arginine kinase n=1 Tax=Euplotes crassus TaxID=5936 RepID=A0AAD1UFI5_EUPCR|nr:unnamed protein product [Moneuplotes crassus]